MSSKNSTTVRIARGLTRAGLRSAPQALAAAVWWRFTRAPARRLVVRPEQARVFARGERWSVRADGLELPAWRWGEGPSVLLVHGWAGRAAQLAAFVDPLLERGLSVVAFDGPASGEAPGRHTSMLHLGHAVAAVGRALGPLHGVVAHSMGAGATAYALRLGLAVDRLALLAPATNPVRYFDLATHVLGLEPDERASLRRAVEARAGTPFERLDGVRTLAQRDLPVLVVHDREDREVPLAEGRAVADALARAELLVTQGFGHNRLLAQEEVVGASTRFLTDGLAVTTPGRRLERELAYGRG